jgi:hypothetical protein
MLHEVNPLDARLTELEAIALVKLLDKRTYYVDQGRSREAHGLGTAIWILWRTLTHQPLQQTYFGEL